MKFASQELASVAFWAVIALSSRSACAEMLNFEERLPWGGDLPHIHPKGNAYVFTVHLVRHRARVLHPLPREFQPCADWQVKAATS